jgi:acyl carrier protein
MYRTGDLGRRNERGVIEFLGRVDHQVKVRGIRIELGEIEAVLEKHEGVVEAVVIAVEDGMGQRLVAYVRPEGSKEMSEEELREHMREKLPEYMVAAVVVMEKLPLTSNGKVDRQQLAAIGVPERGEGEEYIGPRTEVEMRMEEMWRELLGLERVSVHANFFDLGGHSLLAARLMAAVRSSFGVDLPLRAFFENPTVAELSEEVGRRKSSRLAAPASPIIPASRETYRISGLSGGYSSLESDWKWTDEQVSTDIA